MQDCNKSGHLIDCDVGCLDCGVERPKSDLRLATPEIDHLIEELQRFDSYSMDHFKFDLINALIELRAIVSRVSTS